MENLVIISDLHGDSKSLFRILSEINYNQFLSKELNKLVFLGDYIDRGSDSLSIIYSICYLKSTYPESVILMRGNHEAPAEFPFVPHDFPYEIENRVGNRWREIYNKYYQCSDCSRLQLWSGISSLISAWRAPD